MRKVFNVVFLGILIILFASCSGGGGGGTSATSYSIIYNSNDATTGNPPIDNTNYEKGQTVTVQDNTGGLTKSGYSFKGWNTKADGTGGFYTQGTTFQMDTANVILYAMWTANPTYSIYGQVKFNNKGSIPGIPARDLTDEEVKDLGGEVKLIATGLYEKPKEDKKGTVIHERN